MTDRRSSSHVKTSIGGRGGEQTGLRQYNERLILQIVRRAGATSRADIARATGLSAQAVSVIVAGLEEHGYLRRGKKQRGRVGQPSTPLSINPEGAYAVGVSVGRRVLSTLLTDFTGRVVKRVEQRYDYPDPEAVLPVIIEHARICAAEAAHPERLTGVGVAVSSSLDLWADRMGAPAGTLDGWGEIDLGETLSKALDLPAYAANDVAAAATAELVLGRAVTKPSVIYIFLGALVGGAVLLGGRLHAGDSGAAGAIGFAPLGPPGEKPTQLVDIASLMMLEGRLKAHGLPGAEVIETDHRPPGTEAVLAEWRAETADALARAVATTTAMLDCDQVVIDGALWRPDCERLIAACADAFDALGLTGLRRPDFVIGSIGRQARTLGGAVLPLYAKFAPDRDLLLKIPENVPRDA